MGRRKEKQEPMQVEQKKSGANGNISKVDLCLFEKPTQLYRFLKQRQEAHPLFLKRNLSYLKKTKRPKVLKSRKTPKKTIERRFMLLMDQLRFNRLQQNSVTKHRYFNMVFSGLYASNTQQETAEVHVYFCTHVQYDDYPPQEDMKLIGTATIVVNSQSVESSHLQTISIDGALFGNKQRSSGNCAVSYSLLLCVNLILDTKQSRARKAKEFSDCVTVPSSKRRRTSETRTSIRIEKMESRVNAADPAELLQCRLPLFDSKSNCKMPSGVYDIQMSNITAPEDSAWESVDIARGMSSVGLFNALPIIKCHIIWNDFEKKVLRKEEVIKKPTQAIVVYALAASERGPKFHDKRDELVCIWCDLRAPRVYGLMQHLVSCHPRFGFTVSQLDSGIQINVKLSKDLYNSPEGCASRRLLSDKRVPWTKMLFFREKRLRGKRPLENMDCFLLSNSKSGPKKLKERKYYNLMTTVAAKNRDFINDNEDDGEPPWLVHTIKNMIYEFTDLNEAEKHILHLWNMHMYQLNVHADAMIPRACLSFIEQHRGEINAKRFTRTLLCHLCSLADFGMISWHDIYTCMADLNETLAET